MQIKITWQTIGLILMGLIIASLLVVNWNYYWNDRIEQEKTQEAEKIRFENEKLNNATIDGFYQGVVSETAYLIKRPVSLNLNSTERPIYAVCSCISEDNFKKIYGHVPERINVDSFAVKLFKGG